MSTVKPVFSTAAPDGFRHAVLPAIAESGPKPIEERLANFEESREFADAVAFFSNYPEKSLITPRSRAVLYLLVRHLRPKAVLEIGTYHAGTAELLARALQANGHGQLLTTDPFGRERVPPILETWPEALRRHVVFLPVSSMSCFMEANRHNVFFDLAFIDGDHSYEFALYDLQMAARHASPGAVIIMDNVEQAGVYWAVKHFLQRQPRWVELGQSIAEHRTDDPFQTMHPSFPDTSFLILQAPADIPVTDLPRSFMQTNIAATGLAGYRIDFDGRHPGGVLHTVTYFRSFEHYPKGDMKNEQKIKNLSLDVPDGATQLLLSFAESFTTQHDPIQSYRMLEIVLSWRPHTGSVPLLLTTPPVPQTII